ncbi:protein of unknown function [Georgfuchsia toluolica]|uniref:Uncharacterized protein n=1 Tax=Georgfuchsia toluolica TaxID=424218 RepID=A0A916N926_9PROT|nr:protein of unknown function [Georgfuchsia toluolica]
MNRTAIAIVVSVAVISTTLAGTYWVFVTLATHFPARRMLGMRVLHDSEQRLGMCRYCLFGQ